MYLLPRATKLREGYVFTGLCDSVHVGGGLSVPACTTGHMTRGFSVQGGVSVWGRGSLSLGGLCPGWGQSLSQGVSVGRVSVQGISVQGVSVQGVSVLVWGSLLGACEDYTLIKYSV